MHVKTAAALRVNGRLGADFNVCEGGRRGGWLSTPAPGACHYPEMEQKSRSLHILSARI